MSTYLIECFLSGGHTTPCFTGEATAENPTQATRIILAQAKEVGFRPTKFRVKDITPHDYIETKLVVYP